MAKRTPLEYLFNCSLTCCIGGLTETLNEGSVLRFPFARDWKNGVCTLENIRIPPTAEARSPKIPRYRDAVLIFHLMCRTLGKEFFDHDKLTTITAVADKHR